MEGRRYTFEQQMSPLRRAAWRAIQRARQRTVGIHKRGMFGSTARGEAMPRSYSFGTDAHRGIVRRRGRRSDFRPVRYSLRRVQGCPVRCALRITRFVPRQRQRVRAASKENVRPAGCRERLLERSARIGQDSRGNVPGQFGDPERTQRAWASSSRDPHGHLERLGCASGRRDPRFRAVVHSEGRRECPGAQLGIKGPSRAASSPPGVPQQASRAGTPSRMIAAVPR